MPRRVSPAANPDLEALAAHVLETIETAAADTLVVVWKDGSISVHLRDLREGVLSIASPAEVLTTFVPRSNHTLASVRARLGRALRARAGQD